MAQKMVVMDPTRFGLLQQIADENFPDVQVSIVGMDVTIVAPTEERIKALEEEFTWVRQEQIARRE